MSNANRDPLIHSEYELSRYKEIRLSAIVFLGGKCIWCGETESLEFDHIDPETKEYNVSTVWSTPAIFWIEIKKCQLLCPSCHKEKTSLVQVVHGRWRYEKHKCRCDVCRADYSVYRRQRYRRRGD